MKYIGKTLRLYWPFSRSVIQTMLSYRINFFVFVFGGVLRTFVIYYLWKAVFMNSSQAILNGFTSSDMAVYIFISSFSLGFISNDIDSVIGNEVKDGSIAMSLIKPINYHLRMLFHAFGSLFYETLFVSVPLWIIFISVRYAQVGEMPPGIGTVSAYILSLIMGFFIMFLFNFCFGLLAFYVTNLWGVSNLKRGIVGFFSGQIMPLAFFPLWLQQGLSFVPFGSMSYVPVMIYLKKLTGTALLQALGIQVFWVMFMLVLSLWLWNKATKRLTILGG